MRDFLADLVEPVKSPFAVVDELVQVQIGVIARHKLFVERYAAADYLLHYRNIAGREVNAVGYRKAFVGVLVPPGSVDIQISFKIAEVVKLSVLREHRGGVHKRHCGVADGVGRERVAQAPRHVVDRDRFYGDAVFVFDLAVAGVDRFSYLVVGRFVKRFYLFAEIGGLHVVAVNEHAEFLTLSPFFVERDLVFVDVFAVFVAVFVVAGSRNGFGPGFIRRRRVFRRDGGFRLGIFGGLVAAARSEQQRKQHNERAY